MPRKKLEEMTADESEILADQDQTLKKDLLLDDENVGTQTKSRAPLEDEPDDFVRGDLDVKEQMDRASDAIDASIHGYQNQAYEDSPRGELNSSFRNTPGGLEEVEMKTDEALARAHHHPHAKKRPSVHHRRH